MLRIIAYLIVGFFALLLESTLFASWPSVTLRFEFVWILVLFLAFSSPLNECGPIAIGLGLMEDITGAPFLGFFATVYFSFAVLLRAFIAHMFVETLWARLLWVGIFTLLALSLEWGLLAAMGRSEGIQSYLLTYALLQSLVNMVVAAFFLPLLDRVDELVYSNRYVS